MQQYLQLIGSAPVCMFWRGHSSAHQTQTNDRFFPLRVMSQDVNAEIHVPQLLR